MPIVYENEGHARRMQKMYPQMAWKMLQWRADPRCRYCEQETHFEADQSRWKTQVTIDHAIAKALDGLDVEDNWIMACGKCNNDKSKIENKLLAFIQKGKKACRKKSTS